GSSELVTINQLVDIVEEIAGIKLNRTYNLDAPKEVNGRNSDNTKIRQYLGWEPSIRLKDGMAKTYKWIESQILAPVTKCLLENARPDSCYLASASPLLAGLGPANGRLWSIQ